MLKVLSHRYRPQPTDTNGPRCFHNILHFFNGVAPIGEPNQCLEIRKTGGPGADIAGWTPTDITSGIPPSHFAAVVLKAGT
jgi:hypothetical protein